MNTYSDPENVNELITELENLSDKEAIQTFIETHLPNWLFASTPKYCKDYPHLQSNWEMICKANNIQPQKIVVVEYISFDDNHKLIRTICEIMTRHGYVVRRKSEFTGCTHCNSAIPVVEVWHLLKEKGLPVPKTWNNTCSTC